MSIVKSGNVIHDATCAQAEMVRQTAIVGGTAASVKAAEITFHRAVVSSALANGCGVQPSLQALHELGVWGL